MVYTIYLNVCFNINNTLLPIEGKKKINSIDVTTSFDNNNYCVLRVIYNVWCASVGIKRIENALCNNMCICIILTI